MKNQSIYKKTLLALSAVGPGLFLIGYNIGTGSVTTMAKTGAEHGMGLFWALILSCIFTYILMVAYGKVTLVTGKTALFNIKSEFKYGWALSLYFIVALIIGELLALIGVMGIVADLVQEGIRLAFNGQIVDTFWIILFFVILLFFLLWYGRYQTFEKILTALVVLMGISFFGRFCNGEAQLILFNRWSYTKNSKYARGTRANCRYNGHDMFCCRIYYA